MRNFIQPGDSLTIAVTYAGGITAGQGVLVGALFGVAATDGVQNAESVSGSAEATTPIAEPLSVSTSPSIEETPCV